MALSLVKQLARQFPAVLILGPRQCGKTTLATGFIDASYFDLEKPSDYAVFAGDPELAFSRLEGSLILDEAQELPALFRVLRSVIDADRKRAGSFYLLGSVNPSLVRQVSESLAGRVGMMELTPFLYPEVIDQIPSLDDYWLRGGYPEACLEADTDRRIRWMEQYVQALVQRDLAGYGLKTSSQEMRRFLGMLAHVHGGLLNASELGRSLGVSYHTIGGHLDLLEGHFLIRRLQPWHTNPGKRLIKTPKLYVRDSGVLHYLLGIRTARDLLQSPKRGASWEGLMVEHILALERLAHTGSQFWFYRTRAGAEIDLIVERGEERIGYEFKCALTVSRGDASGLKAGLADGVITRGFVVYPGTRSYPLTEYIDALPASALLAGTKRVGYE
ncbi:MAG TPA: ATP-binding protein [Kiritimatiellia bacterium]|nr:ATP-binding protein [Kiritimatiellia bacterium]